MPDMPSPIILPRMPTIHTLSPESEIAWSNVAGSGASSTLTANRAYYVPFRLWEPVRVRQLFINNGTAVSGNVDVGIYGYDLKLRVSAGSTAQSGTSVLQFFNVTDTNLEPGLYYFGAALDNGTGQIFSFFNAPDQFVAQSLGYAIQATAFPLPNPMVPALAGTLICPFMGAVTGRAV